MTETEYQIVVWLLWVLVVIGGATVLNYFWKCLVWFYHFHDDDE